jgi:hypothetical protein
MAHMGFHTDCTQCGCGGCALHERWRRTIGSDLATLSQIVHVLIRVCFGHKHLYPAIHNAISDVTSTKVVNAPSAALAAAAAAAGLTIDETYATSAITGLLASANGVNGAVLARSFSLVVPGAAGPGGGALAEVR